MPERKEAYVTHLRCEVYDAGEADREVEELVRWAYREGQLSKMFEDGTLTCDEAASEAMRRWRGEKGESDEG